VVENVERLLVEACRELRAFAPGWNERHLCNRIYDIWRFAYFNSNRVIPLARRRRIARLAADLRGVSGSLDGEFLEVLRDLAEAGRWCARELRKELDELGGLDGRFCDTLQALARYDPAWRGALKMGGDRRSGDRSLKGSVLGMAVRLYYEAHANPGFSVGGQLVRFANAIGEITLRKTEPFTASAVRAEYNRFRRKIKRGELNLRRVPSLQLLYKTQVTAAEGDRAD
jgi:hypothetical protein